MCRSEDGWSARIFLSILVTSLLGGLFFPALAEEEDQRPDPPSHWISETREIEVGTPEEEEITEEVIFYQNTIGMEFVWVPAGEYQRGSSSGDKDGAADLGMSFVRTPPAHNVELTKGFWLAATPVTQAQWEEVMKTTVQELVEKENHCPSFRNRGAVGIGEDHPVYSVSWEDAGEFCNALSELEGIEYRLPTEAEWEYAARAGASEDFYFGSDVRDLGDYGWHKGNSEAEVHPVAAKTPNSWGLYDMSGNVWEWCADWFGEYPSGKVTDPKGPDSGEYRVLRGGSWNSYAEACRSVIRHRREPDGRLQTYGFRPAFSLVPEKEKDE